MIITLILPQPPGYSETFFRSKIKGMQESGYEVILVTTATDQEFEACTYLQHPKVSKNRLVQAFKMLTVFFSLLPYLKQVSKFIKLEKREATSLKRIIEKLYINSTLLKLETDWIHFGFATMAIDRELVTKAIGAKSAVSFRGFDIGVYPLKHSNCYQRLWKHVDKVHSISYDLLNKSYMLGLPKQTEFKIITPAINLNLFTNQINSIDDKSKRIKFLSIGRLHWKKGFVDTVEALAILKENQIDFSFDIIGEGDEYERIAFAAHQLGILKQVNFLGKIPHNEVQNHLNTADIYLQYSIQEGFCNAVLEAQAMGKLCIVSDAEGLGENVNHSYTGWVVPKKQPELLADQILKTINLPADEKQRIQKNARQRVKEKFALEQQKDAFAEFYKD